MMTAATDPRPTTLSIVSRACLSTQRMVSSEVRSVGMTAAFAAERTAAVSSAPRFS